MQCDPRVCALHRSSSHQNCAGIEPVRSRGGGHCTVSAARPLDGTWVPLWICLQENSTRDLNGEKALSARRLGSENSSILD